VVRGDNHVELALRGADEERVSGKRALDVDASCPGFRDHRADHVPIFAAEETVLPRVWIHAGDGQPRRRIAETGHLSRGEFNHGHQAVVRERAGDLGKRNVHRRQHDAQRLGPEHHHDIWNAAQFGKQVGVPAPRKARGRKGGFVDGRRDDGRHLPRHRVVRRGHDRRVGRSAGRGIHAPRRKRLERFGRMRPVDHRPAHCDDARIRRRLHGDLGSDAGRVAGGDGDQGQRHDDVNLELRT